MAKVDGMIIEFFGPPCSGKTTLAQALTERLGASGYQVHLISSYRPDETGPARTSGRRGVAVLRRMLRAARETVALVRPRSAAGRSVTAALLRLIPPRRMTQSLRIGQYLTRLQHNWHEAENRPRITVFDQAFTQALSSLALVSPGAGRAQLEASLTLVPKPDLLIVLQVSKAVLAARLQQRRRRQGRLERLLEVSPETNLASMPMFDVLEHLAADGTARMLRVGADGEPAIAELLRLVEEIIAAGRGQVRETLPHCLEDALQQ
jgi:thymidylate kinase